MKLFIEKWSALNKVWLLISVLLVGLYVYLCFAYNLQFYTEDERYIQLDMTDLSVLYQWGMGSYRVSSSLGAFFYYPLKSILSVFSNLIESLSGGDLTLLIVPMMLSKLTHSIMAFFGWLWFAVEIGRLLAKRYEITPWSGLLCMLFTAILPINIFLVKTNNYDSLYNIFCLIGSVYFYRYIISKSNKDIFISFFLFSLAMQEKFAAYPIFMVFLIIVPFIIEHKIFSNYLKTALLVTASFTCGSLFPVILRFFVELVWARDISILYKHLPQYEPFFAFFKPLNTARHFTGLDISFFTFIIKYSYLAHVLGFIMLSLFAWFLRKRFDFSKFETKKTFWVYFLGAVQVLFLLWAFASAWYTPPETGRYPMDTPLPGTYIPPTLTDGIPVFYQGANHFEYIFIRMTKVIGFFKPMLYSPVLILIVSGPFLVLLYFRIKDDKIKSLIYQSTLIFNFALGLVVIVNLTGVPFGSNRYANIYATLIGFCAFLNLLVIFLFFGKKRLNSLKILPAAIIILGIVFTVELIPYGPSFQVFGNWFFPKKGCGGWGEPTSALVQASKNDPFLKKALGRTFTTHTGLAIEKPFLTPLINLRLIRSRSQNNRGKRRSIQYLLVERPAIKQNSWLRNVRDTAKTVDGAIVWEWSCNGSSSAWLVDLYKLNLFDFQEKINPDKVERHYRGEWFF